MASNAVIEGKTIEHTASAAISAGDAISLNSTNAQIGIAANDIANGSTGILFIDGVFTLTKATSTDTFAVGADFKLDASGEVVTSSGTGSPDVVVENAKVYKASTASDTTVQVLIKGL